MDNDNIDGSRPAGRSTRGRTAVVAGAVGAVGLLAGGLAAGAISAASADSSAGSGTTYGASPSGGQNTDPSKPMRSDEKLLTGSTKTKVLAAVEAKYPNATVQRAETDSDGVYEAHIVNAGTELIVQVGKDFTITGTQSGHGGGGRGDHDGDQPPASSGSSSSYES